MLTLVFGGLGRRRTMIVFSASKKEFVDAMFERLESKDYSVISYEVETQRTSDGVVHRATIVIRAKAGQRGGVYRPAARKSGHHCRKDRLTLFSPSRSPLSFFFVALHEGAGVFAFRAELSGSLFIV